MEISVQGTHEETVQPEIGRLHASAQVEAGGKDQVLRTATAVVQRLHAELKRLQDAGQVTQIVVRPITTSSWRPVSRGRQQPPIYRAHADVRADFTDFAALADLAAQLGSVEGLELNHVEWRLTDATRRELENVCLTRAVEQARDRALAMARAAGESAVAFVQLADPGMLGQRPAAEAFGGVPRGAMMRSAMVADELAGIEIQPEDLTVGGVVDARFVTVAE
jgi:uncharacterized protein